MDCGPRSPAPARTIYQMGRRRGGGGRERLALNVPYMYRTHDAHARNPRANADTDRRKSRGNAVKGA